MNDKTNNGHIEILGGAVMDIIPQSPNKNFTELAQKFFTLSDQKV